MTTREKVEECFNRVTIEDGNIKEGQLNQVKLKELLIEIVERIDTLYGVVQP